MLTLTGPIAGTPRLPTRRRSHWALRSPATAMRAPAPAAWCSSSSGGVISAKNGHPGTPHNVGQDPQGLERRARSRRHPDVMGKNGSAGPLGAVTSDEITKGDLKETTFEHGSITFNTKTGKLKVTVNGKVVPAF